MPNFVGAVDHANLGCVVVQLNLLENLYLEIKVKVLVVKLDCIELFKFGDELARKHSVVFEALGSPLSQRAKNFHFMLVKMKDFAKKLEGAEFIKL